MSGSWRDTLFVWEGSLASFNDLENVDDTQPQPADAKDKIPAILWKGSWVGCEDCPDARDATKPSILEFSHSEMLFEVSTSKNSAPLETKDPSMPAYKYNMTGGSGWDLGEGDEKSRHRDHTHTILCRQPLLPETKDGFISKSEDKSGTRQTDDSKQHSLVVAQGENEFGAFVSVGYLYGQDNAINRRLVLARRYLEHGDDRAKWTIEELYAKVSHTDSGQVETSSNRSLVPWQTEILHANKLTSRAKRKRDKNTTAKATKPGEIPCLNTAIEQNSSFRPDHDTTQTGFIVKSNLQRLEKICLFLLLASQQVLAFTPNPTLRPITSNKQSSSTSALRLIPLTTFRNELTFFSSSTSDKSRCCIDENGRYTPTKHSELQDDGGSFQLYIVEEEDLAEVSLFIIKAFGADAISFSSNEFSAFEKGFMEPALDFFNGYAAVTAFAEVLWGLRTRQADRVPMGNPLKTDENGNEIIPKTNVINDISPPQLDGLKSAKEKIEAANRKSLVLVLARPSFKNETNEGEKSSKWESIDSNIDVIASVELRLQV